MKKVHDAGHSIGNHSYSHLNLSKHPGNTEVDRQLKECQRVLGEAVPGLKPNLFRPPYGESGIELINAVKTMGLKTIYWSCDPIDYVEGCTATRLFRHVRGTIETAGEGQIVLFHDGHEDGVKPWRTNRTETLKAVELLLGEYSGQRQFVALT